MQHVSVSSSVNTFLSRTWLRVVQASQKTKILSSPRDDVASPLVILRFTAVTTNAHNVMG